MANRYLRATGTWGGSVWASTATGAAGSAPPPTVNDNVHVFGSFTVTLNSDVSANALFCYQGGVLALGQYKIIVVTDCYIGFLPEFLPSTPSAATINMNSGTLETRHRALVVSNVATVNAGTSTIIINQEFSGHTFSASNKIYNNVIVNLMYNAPDSTYTFSLSGEAFFRSLQVRSANDSAHTLILNNTIKVNHFYAEGFSTERRLNIKSVNPEVSYQGILFTGSDLSPFPGSSSGRNVSIDHVYVSQDGENEPSFKAYIGSTSINIDESLPGSYWTYQDPQGASSFKDSLLIAPSENPNWVLPIFSGATYPTTNTNGIDKGGYTFDAHTEGVLSSQSYNIIDNDIVLEVSSVSGPTIITAFYLAVGVFNGQKLSYNTSTTGLILGCMFKVDVSNNVLGFSTLSNSSIISNSIPTSRFYIKISYVSSVKKFRVSYSIDSIVWLGTTDSAETFSSLSENLLRSSRIQLNMNLSSGTKSYSIGSINRIASTGSGNFLAFF